MTDRALQQTVEQALRECATHLARIDTAHHKLTDFMPIQADHIARLSDEQVAWLDQYIYRFTKWQDTMGARVFKRSLELLAEDTQPMAFIDQVNRLEKLGALPSATDWLDLRQLRNVLAHEYGDDTQQQADALNTLFVKLTDIQRIFVTFEHYITPYLQSADQVGSTGLPGSGK